MITVLPNPATYYMTLVTDMGFLLVRIELAQSLYPAQWIRGCRAASARSDRVDEAKAHVR